MSARRSYRAQTSYPPEICAPQGPRTDQQHALESPEVLDEAGSRPLAFRPDIEGLRAVAVLAVLAFHAGIPGFQGGFVGVDVFFVISGFLITNLLIREVEQTGRVDLRAFWARRARRLLPAALVTIVGTLIGASAIMTRVTFPEVAIDAAAAAMYVSNYRFMATATDYFAADASSPLLHFWSLGVEEQFYLMWPVIIATAARSLSARHLRIAIAVIAVSSLLLSEAVAQVEGPLAFFSLPTRAWQLALGAIVSIDLIRLTRLLVC